MSKAIQFKNRNGEKIYPCPYYPVGSIYLSVNNVNPGTIFGGTWEQIKDKFLLACGNTYANGTTGGSTEHHHTTGSHKLTVDEMPAHNHQYERTRMIWAEPAIDTSTAIGSNSTWASGKTNQVWTYNKGGGAAHNHGNTGNKNHMPPYLAIYVWKRVA